MKARISLLTFIKQTVFSTNNAYTKALYKCECGTVKEINMRKVRELRTLSCGCLNHTGNNTRTHGLSKHPLYRIWKGIKNRCYILSNPAYSRYGGIGVKMCDEWLKHPELFIKWGLENGWKRGLEIDKDIISRSLGIAPLIYSPEMCKIVTKKENCNARKSNVLITYNGKTQNIKEWSNELGISQTSIRWRYILQKWPLEKVFSKDNSAETIIEYNGISKNITEWSKELGFKIGTLHSRLSKGWPIEKAFTR